MAEEFSYELCKKIKEAYQTTFYRAPVNDYFCNSNCRFTKIALDHSLFNVSFINNSEILVS